MEQKNANPLDRARHLASTREGQELMRHLQQSSSADLKQAMEQAAAGDYAGVKDTLSELLKDPETRRLLERLGK